MQRLKNLQRLPTNKGDTMILETIADANRVRYEEIEKQVPLEVIKQKALSIEQTMNFRLKRRLRARIFHLYARSKKHPRQRELSQRIFPMFRLPRIMKMQVQAQFPF